MYVTGNTCNALCSCTYTRELGGYNAISLSKQQMTGRKGRSTEKKWKAQFHLADCTRGIQHSNYHSGKQWLAVVYSGEQWCTV